MKKTALIMGLLLSGNVIAMTQLPAGNYQGDGLAVHQGGKNEQYLVESKVTGQAIESTYRVGSETMKYAFQARFDKHGFFEVLMEGTKVGTGYCMSVWCHYSIKIGDFSLEETLTFYQGHLYRLGQKNNNGKLVSWEEDLERE
ncbi:MAG: hypothetical protein HYV97_03245 [Bdellovibrio sp.]|nr:hypothetical protein [Bdellovibrio sp.]